jgi:hypothetical protein
MMTERDEDLERGVALAKSGLRAPSEARARVRAKLAPEVAAVASAARAASSAGAAPFTTLTRFASTARGPSRALRSAVTWAGLGLCAGYWLGFHRVGASFVEPAASRTEAARAPALADGAPGGAAPSASRREAASEAAALETTKPDAKHRAPSAADSRANPSPSAGARVRERARESSAARGSDLGNRTTAARPPQRATPGAAASSFAAEVALLERAERAIRAGEGALALVFLDELDQKFPVSSLGEERAAARVLASCEHARSNGTSAREAARVAAERFIAKGSAVYADRVRQLCELGTQNAPSSVEDPDTPGH